MGVTNPLPQRGEGRQATFQSEACTWLLLIDDQPLKAQCNGWLQRLASVAEADAVALTSRRLSWCGWVGKEEGKCYT